MAKVGCHGVQPVNHDARFFPRLPDGQPVPVFSPGSTKGATVEYMGREKLAPRANNTLAARYPPTDDARQNA